jgi:hypothetical protein
VGPTYHGYSQENREAMYRWFNRCTGISDAKTEPSLVIEDDQTLWCAPHGQVAELQSKPIYSFTQEKSRALAAKRPKLDGAALARTVAEALRLPTQSSPASGGAPEFRILRPLPKRGYPFEHALPYMVETDRGVHAIVYRLSREPWFSRPPRENGKAVLYVSHRSADEELRSEPFIRDLINAEPEAAFYACDVRGVGDSQPQTTSLNSFNNIYGSDYFYAIHSIMLDYPYVGQRTFDVLRVLDWHLQCQGYPMNWFPQYRQRNFCAEAGTAPCGNRATGPSQQKRHWFPEN